LISSVFAAALREAGRVPAKKAVNFLDDSLLADDGS
jgi:hypothetical protein